MNRTWRLYAALAAVLLVSVLVALRLGGSSPAENALRMLGKGERQFQQAKEEIVMGSGDAAPALVRYAVDPHKTRRGRVQALEVLKLLAKNQQRRGLGPALLPLLADTAPAIRSALLELYATANDTAAVPALCSMLQSVRDSAGLVQVYAALRASAQPLMRRLDDAVADHDRPLLDSAVGRVWNVPADRMPYFLRAARFLRGVGDSAAAKRLTYDLGLVPRWWVTGPFPLDWVTGAYRNMGPDTVVFDSAASFVGKGGAKCTWHAFGLQDMDGMMWFPVRDELKCTMFLFTYVRAIQATEATMYLGAQDGLRVWWNGTNVITRGAPQGLTPDEFVVRVSCAAGNNSLLVRFDRYISSGPVKMSLRLTGADGHAMKDVRFVLDTLR